jgi:DNA-binding transcriptional MerR regulator
MSSFSLADLCDLADVTPRTVRFYIAQGLLRPPAGAGPAARYDDGHLYRLRLIRRLQKDHLPLAEIRTRLDALDDRDVERLVTEPGPVVDSAAEYVARVLGTKGAFKPSWSPDPSIPGVPPLGPAGLPTPRRIGEPEAPYALASMAPPESPPPPLLEPTRSQWERIALTPDVELHVRRPLSRFQNRRVDRLLEAARQILKEVDE